MKRRLHKILHIFAYVWHRQFLFVCRSVLGLWCMGIALWRNYVLSWRILWKHTISHRLKISEGMYFIWEPILWITTVNIIKQFLAYGTLLLFIFLFLVVSQGFSSVFYYSYGFSTKATRSNSTKESNKTRFTVRQRLDRRWVCERDWEHGF